MIGSRYLPLVPGIVTLLGACSAGPVFTDDFATDDASAWEVVGDQAVPWSVEAGAFLAAGDGRDSARSIAIRSVADAAIDVRCKLGADGRQTFGVFLRAQSDGSRLMVRYYDQYRALHLLQYDGQRAKYTDARATPVELEPDTWYRLTAAIADDRLFAKIWPESDPEPDWQLDTTVDLHEPGRIGLAAHDTTVVAFDDVRVWTDGGPLQDVQRLLADETAERQRRLRDELELAVSIDEFPQPGRAGLHDAHVPGREYREVRIVPFTSSGRQRVGGQLTIESHGGPATAQPEESVVSLRVDAVDIDDTSNVGYHDDGSFRIPFMERSLPIELTVQFQTDLGKSFVVGRRIHAEQTAPYREYVARCLETLIEHGRDRYGPDHSPLWMAVIDVDTLQSPREPELYDALVRLEEDRLHRRAERGANPWYDQATARAMYRMSQLTGDAKYREAADDCLRYFLENCRKRDGGAQVYENGMPAWGSHVYWNCFEDRPDGDQGGDGPHEILIYEAEWAKMYRVAPDRVREIIEGIWRWHVVDETTGQHNRHDDDRVGCDFAFSGGSFVHAFAFLHAATGERIWLDRARLVADWHQRHADSTTGLVPDAPSTGSRYDATHCMTSVTGPHVAQLLAAFKVTGDHSFFETAAGYVRAYDTYGWDEDAGRYHGMLALDGTPVPGDAEVDRAGSPIPGKTTKNPSDYGAWAPAGYVDVWRTAIFSYEFPLIAAQAAVRAWELSATNADERDPILLRAALRWARCIEGALPPRTGRRWKSQLEAALPGAQEGGTYAENYGRAISFFVHLARATGEGRYLDRARALADEAVTELYRNGLFRGHPAKPYFENTNGVGILLWALLELDAPATDLGGAF